MFEFMMTDAEKKLRQEVVDFVRNDVPKELMRTMDKDEIEYPYEYVRALAAKNLLGLRFPKKWGGRGLNWSAKPAPPAFSCRWTSRSPACYRSAAMP